MTRERPKLGGMRILVVEDNYHVASDMAAELERLGADVVGPVGALPDALGLIAAGERLDRAVLDVDLRGKKVFPAADELIARNIPFVFATGYDDVVIPERYGRYPRCLKPIDYNELVDLLASVEPPGRDIRS
jgi:CheY-like chemotaxis protein